MSNKNNIDGINLLNNIDAPKNSFDLFYLWATKYGRYIVIGVEVVTIIIFGIKFIINQEYDSAVSNSLNIQSKLESSSTVKKIDTISSYQGKISALSNVYAIHVHDEYYLNKVISLIPQTIYVSGISLQSNKMNITGTANSYSDIQNLENNFKSDTKDFSNVLVSQLSNSSSSSQGQSGIQYSLSFNIKGIYG